MLGAGVDIRGELAANGVKRRLRVRASSKQAMGDLIWASF